MKKISEKIKKYSFWTGLASASVLLLTTISKAFGLKIDNQIAEDVIMSVCGVLTALGIVCVPKQKPKKEEDTTVLEDKTNNSKKTKPTIKTEDKGNNLDQNTKKNNE